MEKFRSRMIALLLAFSMILSIAPISTAAEEGQFLTTKELEDAGFDLEDKVNIIIETKDKAAVERRVGFFGSFEKNADSAAASVKKTEEKIQKESKRNNIEFETNAIFSVLEAGMSVNIKVKDVDALKGLSNIQSIKPEAYIERVPLEGSEQEDKKIEEDASSKMYSSLDQVFAQKAWGLGYKGEGMVVSVIDTGIDPDHKDWNTEVMDKVEGRKYTEEDMNNLLKSEELKDRFTNGETIKGKYFNSKVVYGYNYSDKNNNIKDVFSEQHGQHVGGTIAATGNDKLDNTETVVTGVAPHSQILAMKTFSNDQLRSVVWEHIWVEAMEDSILLGADVLNMSLGTFWSHMVSIEETLTGSALAKAREKGVITAIAAGNDRNNSWGLEYHNLAENIDTSAMGGPANLPGSFSVGSIDNTHLYTQVLNFDGEEHILSTPYAEAYAEENTPVFYPESAGTEEGKRFLGLGNSYDDIDPEKIKDKIVVVYRGEGSFSDKYDKALEKGAAGLIIIDNIDSPFPMNMTGINARDSKPVIMITKSVGEQLINYIKDTSGEPVVEITKDKKNVKINDVNLLSEFSSWGPSMDLSLKPDIAGPGGNITSLQNDDGYMTMSGTSMATPHIAGGTALVMEYLREKGYADQNTNDIVELAELVLMNTADPIRDPNSENAYYLPRQIGSGMMNLEKALKSDVTLKVTGTNDTRADGKFELKSVKENPTVKLELTPLGNVKESREYTVKAIFVKDIIENGRITERTENSEIIELGKIDLNNKSTLEATLDISGIDSGQYIEGYIFLEAPEGHINLGAPFFGFKEGENITWDNLPIIDGMNDFDEPNNYKPYDYDRNAFINIRSGEGYLYWNQWMENEERTTFFNTHKENRGSEVLPGITPNIAILRHAKDIRFNILDSNQKTLRELFIMPRVAKSAFFDRNPYNFLNWDGATNWDGTVKGKSMPEGNYYYQILGKAATPTAEDQEYLYQIVLDNTAPEIEATFDEEAREITIHATDNLSGLTWIGIEDSESGEFLEKDYTDKQNRNLEESLTIELPETEEFNSGKVYAYAWDASRNVNSVELDVTKLEEQDTTEEPQIEYDVKAYKHPLIEITEPVYYAAYGKNTKEIDIHFNVSRIAEIDSVELYFVEDIPQIDDGQEVSISGKFTPERIKTTPDTTADGKDPGTYNIKAEYIGENIPIEELEEGINAIRVLVKGKNTEGKLVEESVIREFRIDRTPVLLELDYPEETEDSEAIIKINAKENMNYFELHLDDNMILREDKTFDGMTPIPIDITHEQTVNLKFGENTFTLIAYDDAGNETKEEIIITRTGEEPQDVERVYGEGRIETAVEISKRAFEKSDHIVIAGSKAEADVLSAGSYAHLVGGPILQVTQDHLDTAVMDEILRLGAQEITIIGGEAAVSENVKKALEDNEFLVHRISGKDRFETSLEIAKEVIKENPNYTAFIANGLTKVDALAISPVAAKENSPVLLTDGKTFIPGIEEIVNKAEKRVIVGGGNAVNPSITQGVYEIISGKNRFETSVIIAKKYFADSEKVLVASGLTFVDALSASSLSIAENAPILLGTKDGLTKEVQEHTKSLEVILIGGSAVINR